MSLLRILPACALALGCGGLHSRPIEELEQLKKQCAYPTPLDPSAECLAVASELDRRREVALAAYRARWFTPIAKPNEDRCRAASRDIALLESLRDPAAAHQAGVCAGRPRFGWERCDRDAVLDDRAPLVVHATTLLRCHHVDALRPFFAAFESTWQPRWLDRAVAEALLRSIGASETRALLDEADEEPWPLVEVVAAHPVSCVEVSGMRARPGLRNTRAILGARNGCGAAVALIAASLENEDPEQRRQACVLFFEVPSSARSPALLEARRRVEASDPYRVDHVVDAAGPTRGIAPLAVGLTKRTDGLLALGDAITAVVLLPYVVLGAVLGELVRGRPNPTVTTRYPVREACAAPRR
jgi:hypothetical protein